MTAANPVADLLRDLDRHRVTVTRDGGRVLLKAQAGDLPAELVARARTLKADLLRVIPDASALPVVHFRPAGAAGNAWATMLGWPGESREALVEYLVERWPDAEVRQ